MLVLLLAFGLQVSLSLHECCLSKPSAHEIETTGTQSKCITQWKGLNASLPHPGKVYIPYPQSIADSQMPLGFLGSGGGDVEASKICFIQLMFYSMMLIP